MSNIGDGAGGATASTNVMYRFRNKLARTIHDWGCRAILETPPLAIRRAPLVICSMVSRRDLLMYLVAIKLFYRRIGEGRVCIIGDGTLDARCRAILTRHIQEPEIIDIGDIDTAPCPRGGTWERLLHVLNLSSRDYVIQLDSDVVVRRELPEVVALYRENRCFTLGTRMGSRIVSATEAAKIAQRHDTTHVQIASEQRLDRLDDPYSRRYVRGCSGFAGYARGAISRSQAEDFSRAMQGLVGDLWLRWGSEQVASNFLIANSAGAEVLPVSKYVNYLPPFEIGQASLVHFLGEHRFRGAVYMRESRRLMKDLGPA